MWESVDSVDSVGVLHGKRRNFADLAQKKKKEKENITSQQMRPKFPSNFTTLLQFASYLCVLLSSKYKMWVAGTHRIAQQLVVFWQ